MKFDTEDYYRFKKRYKFWLNRILAVKKFSESGSDADHEDFATICKDIVDIEMAGHSKFCIVLPPDNQELEDYKRKMKLAYDLLQECKEWMEDPVFQYRMPSPVLIRMDGILHDEVLREL